MGKLITLVSLNLLISAAPRLGMASPEDIPSDQVIHPVLRIVQPEVIPESLENPVYPREAQELKLGAQVVLGVQMSKVGKVTRILSSDVRPLRTSCDGASRGLRQDKRDPPSLPPAIAREFVSSASAAVKQWKYRPMLKNREPVSSAPMVIVNFDPCLEIPDSD